MEQIILSWKNERLKLFALWLFILFNIIFRDIHQLTLKSHLEMLLTGYFNGIEITDSIMLAGAIIVNIPISMLLVSLFVDRKVTRILSIIAAILLTLSFILSPPSDMDDIFHLIVELIAIGAIILTSIKWQKVTIHTSKV